MAGVDSDGLLDSGEPRLIRRALPMLVALVLAGCAGTVDRAQMSDATTNPSPSAPTPTVPALPATAMMVELDIAGEPFSASGDPSAPITVVEFSDFG